MKYQLQMPVRMALGKGVLAGLVEENIKRNRVKQVLVCTDETLRKRGISSPLEAVLARAGVSVEIVDHIRPEPSVQDVENVLGTIKNRTVDLLIAMGGGSVMDTAKIIALLLGASCGVKDLLSDPSGAQKFCLTLMIPTTCGTGSEATCNAIVAVPEEQVKKGIVNAALIPDEVILDADCIKALPKPIIAATGVDALAHCVECYTSKKATPLSDLYALGGAKLIFHHIEKAYTEQDDSSLQNMLLGAFYGGAAITGSGTTAVHALSYPLGGRYHIPHGVSNAILFARVMIANKDACGERLAALCDAVYPEMNTKTAGEKTEFIIQRISEIVKNTNIPVSLKDFGVKEEDLEDLVQAGSRQERLLINNMKELSLNDIRDIYRQVI
jgi:alcohol dehydrogenase class IV